MEIATRRLLLRDFRESDRNAFLGYQADRRYLALYGRETADPAHASELLQTFEQWASEQPRRNYQLAIIERSSEELVGCCVDCVAQAVTGLQRNWDSNSRRSIGAVTAMQSKLRVRCLPSGSTSWGCERFTA